MLSAVDPRTVINPQQARRFLTAVEAHSERGRRLKAFFACMYYAALRPEEVSELRRSNLTDLPEQPGHWGEIRLTSSAAPRSGSRWTESAKSRQQGPLKHRALGGHSASACPPRARVLLREHLSEYVLDAPETLLFVGAHGGAVTRPHIPPRIP